MHREIAELVRKEIHDPRVAGITLTGVDVAPDMSHAKVFITDLAGREHALGACKALNHASGFLRHFLIQRLQMRHIPDLRFCYDESVEQGARIDDLLRRARTKDDSGDDSHGRD
jgi:ribosome-binding factor A